MSRPVRAMVATLLATGMLAAPAPRPSQHADRSLERKTMERVSLPLPSPDVLGGPGSRTVTPAPRPDDPVPVRITPSPSPTGMRPASTAKPRTASTLRGTATWFRSPSAVSAAGPALRAALGPGWRGTRVRVCAGGRCVWTVLGDWCACRDDRVIDLHAPLFARLAPLSRGVMPVEVSW